MKTMGVVVACLVLVLSFASVSSAQVGVVWQVSGLTSPVGQQITAFALQLELGIWPQFKVFGSAEVGGIDLPVYGSGLVSADNVLVITFTLVDAEVDLDVNLSNLNGTVKLYRYSTTYSDTNGTATFVGVYQ